MVGRQGLGAVPCGTPFQAMISSLAPHHSAWHSQNVQQILFSLSNEFDLEFTEFEKTSKHLPETQNEDPRRPLWLEIQSFLQARKRFKKGAVISVKRK